MVAPVTTTSDRYHRSMLLFGAEGQERMRAVSVALVGSGGLGSPLAQQLALLGVRRITPIDDEELDNTNRNRFVGARAIDPIPGSLKVSLIDRLIRETNPEVESVPLPVSLISEAAFSAVREADWVFGCLDEDGPRMVLSELCVAYRKPYIDLASDVPEPGAYGGRVVVSTGASCLSCLGVLDAAAIRQYLQSSDDLALEARIYGVPSAALAEKGPSVAPLNQVIAGLAAMELMVAVTGMRPPTRHQEYRGWESKVVVRTDAPQAHCPICASWGQGATADVERYLRIPHLRKRR